MLRKYGDLIAGLVTMAFAIGLYVASLFIKQFIFSGVGADFLPKIIAGILLVLGGILVLRGVADIRARQAAGAKQGRGEDPADTQAAARPHYKAVMATFLLLLLYGIFIDKLGFPIVTVVYLFLQILILTPREKVNCWRFALISLVSTAAIYGIFTYAFKLMLPMGILA